MAHRRIVRTIALAALAVSFTGCATPAQAAPVGVPATVIRIVDGDTLDARDDRGATIKIRVLSIDTPETKDPRKPKQCWGEQATQFARDTLLGKRVVLVADPTQDVRDRFGRDLFYVHVGGASYSVLAARAGAGRAYVFDKRHPGAEITQIRAAEREARANRAGLWGNC